MWEHVASVADNGKTNNIVHGIRGALPHFPKATPSTLHFFSRCEETTVDFDSIVLKAAHLRVSSNAHKTVVGAMVGDREKFRVFEELAKAVRSISRDL